MTTQDKLPPLAEVFRGVYSNAQCGGLTFVQEHGLHLYDAHMKAQEARIAELEAQAKLKDESVRAHILLHDSLRSMIAEFSSSSEHLYYNVEGLVSMHRDALAQLTELEKERETFRAAFTASNDQAEHVTSLFLPVEAEKDQLARKVAELESCRDALNSANIEIGIEKERLRAELEELAEKRREEAWAWMMVANERGAELAQCKLDLVCLGESSNVHLERIRILEAELAAFRELAREADDLYRLAKTALNVLHVIPGSKQRICQRLAALHKEE